LDQTGRNGVYAEVGNLWAALLKDEQRKLKDEIESDTAGKGELARIIGLMPNPYPLAFYSIRMDRLHFYIKDPYFVDLINAYLKLNLRIEKSRIASAPVIYDWENTSRYQEILNRWETTAQSDPSKELSEELTRLKASNHFNWSPMLIALAMGLVCTWFWIWLCGIGVEFLNLLLGHFEWMKQLQEKSKN